MKTTPFLALLLSLPAFASPARDALLGSYGGESCHLTISAAHGGETDVTFTDNAGERTLFSVGRTLEAQLARGTAVLRFDHTRSGLGDMTVHLSIQLDTRGRPSSMSGTGWGWGGNTVIACTFRE